MVEEATIRQNLASRRFTFLSGKSCSRLGEVSVSYPSTTVSNMNSNMKVHKTEQHSCKRCRFEYGGNPSHDMPCDSNCCMSVGYLEIPLGADILTTKGERLCWRHLESYDQIESVGIEIYQIRHILNINKQGKN